MSVIAYTVIVWFGLVVLCVFVGLGWTVYDAIREERRR